MPVEKRLTVNLTRRANAALEQCAERSGDSQTDVVNRALALLNFVDARLAAGDELTLRTAEGETTRVVML